jgi:SAM-dependent methyltransferase
MNRPRGMHPMKWIPPHVKSVLDVGCNVGELLCAICERLPGVKLAGCDVNEWAVAEARKKLPKADIRVCSASELPFADSAFDCVTCIETLEHIPPTEWHKSLREMHRVLVPGGRLVLRTPHAGLFGWLDSNNIRFRFPQIYKRLIKRGRRDDGYTAGSDGVVWHYHFTREELIRIAGAGWEVEATWYGGLLLFPIGDYLLWPFYRLNWKGGIIRKVIETIRIVDFEINYGQASYGVLLALRKIG